MPEATPAPQSAINTHNATTGKSLPLVCVEIASARGIQSNESVLFPLCITKAPINKWKEFSCCVSVVFRNEITYSYSVMR